MATILTATEAANVLRCSTTDDEMLAMLPLVDEYIKNASGRDWAADSPIQPAAKSAARMLLVRWHEDPGGMVAGKALGFGLTSILVQLEALALQLQKAGVPAEKLDLLVTNIDGEMAITANLVLIFNHAMSAGAPAAVTLETAAGVSVATVNTLDVTAKILTVNPEASLSADTEYVLVINAAADIYGQTITAEVRFKTA